MSVITVYKQYKPIDISEKQTKINYNFDKIYTLESFAELVASSNENMIVIYFDESAVNSQYFFNTTLPTILNQRGLKTLSNIIYVNVVDAPESLTKAMAKTKYGYSNLPCLVNLHYSEGVIQIDSILEEDGTTQFTSEAIIKWLINNKVIPE